MALSMSQVPAAFGLFGLGDAQDDYADCRDTYPASKTRDVLTQNDPCYPELVAYRRSEGRDPLGRDLWGPRGAPGPRPHQDETLQQAVKRCMEENGISRVECETRLALARPSSQTPVVVFGDPRRTRGPVRYQGEPSSTPAWIPVAIGAMALVTIVAIFAGRRS